MNPGQATTRETLVEQLARDPRVSLGAKAVLMIEGAAAVEDPPLRDMTSDDLDTITGYFQELATRGYVVERDGRFYWPPFERMPSGHPIL